MLNQNYKNQDGSNKLGGRITKCAVTTLVYCQDKDGRDNKVRRQNMTWKQ
jgi:hypothetical protein